MNGLPATLQQQWRKSGSFRLWTILAIAGLVINLTLTVLWQMEIITFEDSPPANDLKIYLEAGNRFLQRENLYTAPRADFGLYAYSPVFAIFLGFLAFLPYKAVWIVDALLHIIIYWLIYWRWFKIFREQRLYSAAETLVRLFPLWIIFTGLLYEIAYMNIYIFMAFIATLLLEAMLYQQTRRAILWLAILLPIKPQWAFLPDNMLWGNIGTIFNSWNLFPIHLFGTLWRTRGILAITIRFCSWSASLLTVNHTACS
jgi:hypothetical protein